MLPIDAEWWVQRLRALAREDGAGTAFDLRVDEEDGIAVLRSAPELLGGSGCRGMRCRGAR